mgnify:CR=1 FL=1
MMGIFNNRKPRNESRIFKQEKTPRRGGVSEDLDDIEEVAVFDIEIGFLHQTTDFANFTIKFQRSLSSRVTFAILERIPKTNNLISQLVW